MEEELIMNELSKKKKIITSNDKNNINYYKELNSRDPKTYNQSIDYYDLLKQQIKLYKELNASLKEEIETVKKCKQLKEFEESKRQKELEQEKLKQKDEMNYMSYSNNFNEEQNENETKITELQTRNRMLEESVYKLKNTLDRANEIFPNLFEKIENYTQSAGVGFNQECQTSSIHDFSKSAKQNNLLYSNSCNCNDEHCTVIKKELKRLEDENQNLKGDVIRLNQTIQFLKLNNNNHIKINENNNENYENGKDYINVDININKDDLVNDNMDSFKDKLLLDNKRLRVYIDKIGELQNILNQYKYQINYLNDEINQKDIKIQALISKIKSKSSDNKEQHPNEELDNVNIDIDLINQSKRMNELYIELSQLKSECERLKFENEKLIDEKELNININNNNEDQREKLIQTLREKNLEYENEINKLRKKLEKNNEIKNINENGIENYKNTNENENEKEIIIVLKEKIIFYENRIKQLKSNDYII